MKYFTEKQALAEFKRAVEKAGGIRAFARDHSLSAAYVSDITLGRRSLSERVLKIIRLEKWVIVNYIRVYD